MSLATFLPYATEKANTDARSSLLSPHESGAHTSPGLRPRAPVARPEHSREHFGNGRGATGHLRCAHVVRGTIGTEHDMWVQDRRQRVEVTAARRGEEGVDNFSLPRNIGVGNPGGDRDCGYPRKRRRGTGAYGRIHG
jgi:hypothetical protein